MKIFTLTGIMCLAVLAGCGRQEPPATAPHKTPKAQAIPAIKAEPAAGAAATSIAPPTATANPGVATATSPTAEAGAKTPDYAAVEVVDTNLSMLQEALESYTRATKRKVIDLQQLVTEQYLTKIPAAPKGRRYVVDQATQTVKSVNE